jgi:CRP-like cAMP-binding protein
VTQNPSSGKALTKEEVMNLLYKIPFFNDFTNDEKIQIASMESFVKRYENRNHIIAQGDQDNSLYVLLKGIVYITKNGNPYVKISKLKPGAIFGEISFLSNTPRTTNVVAEDNVVALEMNPSNIMGLGKDLEVKVQKQLIKVLIKRLDRLNDALIKINRLIPEESRLL